jgi:lipoprotein-releasing system permease protein
MLIPKHRCLFDLYFGYRGSAFQPYALIMMILDKSELKNTFNLGTEIKDLRKIFLLQGTLLSVFGGIIGLLLGIVIVLLQQHFQLVMITPTWLTR